MKTENFEIHFAPVQGSTDFTYRNLHQQHFGGIDAYYTPFIRLEKGESFRNRDLRDIDPELNRVDRLIPQLIASEPEELRTLLQTIAGKGHTQADINLGCPFPMLARRGKGAGILPFPEKVKALLEHIVDFPTVKCSVKMRLGWENPTDCLALLPILNDTPLSHITLHARIGIQQYDGTTDKEAFARFYERCEHPLLYNGDILRTENVTEIEKTFPRLSGVMIGRGLLADPILASAYKSKLNPTSEEKQELYARFHEDLYTAYASRLQGDHQILAKMKTLWEHFLPDSDPKVRKRIRKSTSTNQYLRAVSEIL